jgi:hypothetical protein
MYCELLPFVMFLVDRLQPVDQFFVLLQTLVLRCRNILSNLQVRYVDQIVLWQNYVQHFFVV